MRVKSHVRNQKPDSKHAVTAASGIHIRHALPTCGAPSGHSDARHLGDTHGERRGIRIPIPYSPAVSRGREAPALTRPNQSAISLRQHDNCSLNNLVRRGQSGFRNGKAERLGGLEVDGQLDFCDLLHRQVGRLLALENTAGIVAEDAIDLLVVCADSRDAKIAGSAWRAASAVNLSMRRS